MDLVSMVEKYKIKLSKTTIVNSECEHAQKLELTTLHELIIHTVRELGGINSRISTITPKTNDFHVVCASTEEKYEQKN